MSKPEEFGPLENQTGHNQNSKSRTGGEISLKIPKRNVPNAKTGLLLRQLFSELITGLGEALQHT
ncbi:MAG: hypothetical protein M1609_10295 [Firmicutes bacterium]|nr:hypothetical protein [Bacillota bacterium]